MTHFVVAADSAGRRLDQILAEVLGSRRLSRRLLAAGRVRLEGRVVKVASRIVPAGVGIEVLEDEGELPAEVSILYQDEDVLAVDKPSGLAVQGTRRAGEDHLVAQVERLLRAQGFGPAARPALHQRLDQGTSGVVLFGLSRRANVGLGRAFSERRAEKFYLARVRPEGDLAETWEVRDRLRRRTERGVTRVQRDEEGREAVTGFRLLEKAADGTALVEARPRTGRTHQIRVHLAESGCPVVGDVKYGGRELAASRLMLHAWRVNLEHPGGKGPLELVAPPPTELTPTPTDV